MTPQGARQSARKLISKMLSKLEISTKSFELIEFVGFLSSASRQDNQRKIMLSLTSVKYYLN